MIKQKELDTEQKIKEAARKIFHAKGFEATRTRDIAAEAGINLALLNYYFRSKKKLYDLIVLETMNQFFGAVFMIMNKAETNLQQKLFDVVETYIDQLTAHPDIPIFVMSEVRGNPEGFNQSLNIAKRFKESIFFKQFQEEKAKGKIPNINPLHLLMNLSSLVVFPFVAQPMITTFGNISAENYNEIIHQRKRLIPMWVEAMLKVE